MVFFFRGSALQVFGQVAEQCGRGKAKLFLREEKDLLCLGSFFRTAGEEGRKDLPLHQNLLQYKKVEEIYLINMINMPQNYA